MAILRFSFYVQKHQKQAERRTSVSPLGLRSSTWAYADGSKGLEKLGIIPFEADIAPLLYNVTRRPKCDIKTKKISKNSFLRKKGGGFNDFSFMRH